VKWTIPPGAKQADIDLLENIKTVLVDNEQSISLVLSTLNKGIAQMVRDNQQQVNKVAGKVLGWLTKVTTANANALDPVATAILQRIIDYSQQNEFLLTQIAAAAGLTQPGDPLEAALIDRATEAPEIAYSASLLIALREAMAPIERIAVALERIADAQGAASASDESEIESADETAVEAAAAAPTAIEDWPAENLE
jgi:hypothetical protein